MILNMISEKNGIFEFTLNLREIFNYKLYINNIKINTIIPLLLTYLPSSTVFFLYHNIFSPKVYDTKIYKNLQKVVFLD